MSYLDVITLAQAKTYFIIDDTQNETDAEITQMIKSALSYLEKKTNHIFYMRDISYDLDSSGCVRIYDFPVNIRDSVLLPEDLQEEKKSLYTNLSSQTADSLIVNVGYSLPASIPPELIDAALQMIKVWYYESEKQANTTLIPESVKEVIEVNKRFIL